MYNYRFIDSKLHVYLSTIFAAEQSKAFETNTKQSPDGHFFNVTRVARVAKQLQAVANWQICANANRSVLAAARNIKYGINRTHL